METGALRGILLGATSGALLAMVVAFAEQMPTTWSDGVPSVGELGALVMIVGIFGGLGASFGSGIGLVLGTLVGCMCSLVARIPDMAVLDADRVAMATVAGLTGVVVAVTAVVAPSGAMAAMGGAGSIAAVTLLSLFRWPLERTGPDTRGPSSLHAE